VTGVDAALKRSLDLAIGGLGLVLALPLILVVAAASLWGQGRIGVRSVKVLGTRGPITMYAFGGPAWARGAHLSRLPSLLLVLSGRISLLGPRPVPLHRAGDYAEAMDFLQHAKPGFIGPWWLVGLGRPGSIKEELHYDLHYLRNYSIWADLHILVQVARALLSRRWDRARSVGGPRGDLEHARGDLSTAKVGPGPH
jgi:lipopolysaccharide/colanic/teichoic acid biosynthesis glycosyltransferase